jgi:hypothetical protein
MAAVLRLPAAAAAALFTLLVVFIAVADYVNWANAGRHRNLIATVVLVAVGAWLLFFVLTIARNDTRHRGESHTLP